MYTIKYHKSHDEARVCNAFLLWQCKISHVVQDISSLKDSLGRERPVVYDRNGKVYAVGFDDLYKKWAKDGQTLC